MQKNDSKTFEAYEMWQREKLLKVKWTGHKSNEEVPKMVKEKRMLIKSIRDRQKNWVGHVLRRLTFANGMVWEGGMERKW